MLKLQKLHQYWHTQKSGKLFPSRKDIDPLDFWYALGDVSLIDVETEAGKTEQFRIRLLGSNIQARIGQSLTRKYLQEFPETGSLNKMLLAYRQVLNSCEPVAYPSFFLDSQQQLPFICCIWPLSSNGIDIDMLLCCRERIWDDEIEHINTKDAGQFRIWPYQDWAGHPLLSALHSPQLSLEENQGDLTTDRPAC
ncbi:PAS domain-containing protein [Kiloniella laminariae]|uniref:PAS domain-containing protein n=1 Tax=Kiloniella laminariae TaxID=454162 RepID=A0ABT4LK75_9PROT|nr:PAS domain-containing protein [Kiloniella laminariae]MCZ4281508.1 PAS domain-containing protein [Kiloniella laminariae]